MHRHAAGIDIGSTFHVVAVPADADEEPVRTFNSFTGELNQLADWLTTSLLRIVVVNVGKTSTALGAFYRRLAARIGKAKAVTATARKIAVLFYNTAAWVCVQRSWRRLL